MINEKSPAPPGNIPIMTHAVSVYLFRKKAGKIQFLLLKRKSRYMFGLWQQVSGRIEQGENAAQAIIREIKEETGLTPNHLWSADIVEVFYEDNHKCIHIIPVFAALVTANSKVVLSEEHSAFKWLSTSQAKKHFAFPQQKSSIDMVYKEFALKKPSDELLIL